MIFRIFIGILIVGSAILLHDIYQTKRLYAGIFEAPEGSIVTSENADLSVVEFLSYSCSHCRDAHPIVQNALERDKKVRYIPRPLIPDGENALTALKLVYAAGVQGQFIPAHNFVMDNFQEFNAQAIQDFTLELGLDAQQLETDMADPDLLNRAQQNTSMFISLGGTGTPYFLAEDGTLLTPQNGPITVSDLLTLFSQARNNL